MRTALAVVLGVAGCSGAPAAPVAVDLAPPPARDPAGTDAGSSRRGVADIAWADGHVLVRTARRGRVWWRRSAEPVGPWIGIPEHAEVWLDTSGETIAISTATPAPPEARTRERWRTRLLAASDGRELGQWPGRAAAAPILGTLVVVDEREPGDGPTRITVRDGSSGRGYVVHPPVPDALYVRPSTWWNLAPSPTATPDGRLVVIGWSTGLQLVDLDRGGAARMLPGGAVAMAPPRWIAVHRQAGTEVLDGRTPSDPGVVLADPRCAGPGHLEASPVEAAFVLATHDRTLCLLDARQGGFRWVTELEGKLGDAEAWVEDGGMFCGLTWLADGMVLDAVGCGSFDGLFDVRSGAAFAPEDLPPSFTSSSSGRGGWDQVRLRAGETIAGVAPDGRTALVMSARGMRVQDVAGRSLFLNDEDEEGRRLNDDSDSDDL